MVPNATSKVQMFSQVTKTSAIFEHAIHRETVGDLDNLVRFRDLLAVDLDFRADASRRHPNHHPTLHQLDEK